MRLNSAPIRDLTIYTYGAEATAIARWPFDVAELLPGAVPVADRVPQMPLRINCRHVHFIFGVEAGASYVPDGPAIARWPFDVAELLPGAVPVADRVPQMPVAGDATYVQPIVCCGCIYSDELATITRWPFDVAELLPGAVPVADRVPQTSVVRYGAKMQFIVEAGASHVLEGPAVARWPFDVAELLPGAVPVADRVPQMPVGSSARQVQYARPPRESELFSPGQVRQAVLTGWAPQEPGGHSDADVAVDGGAKGQRHEVLHGVPPVPGDIGLPRQGGNSVRP